MHMYESYNVVFPDMALCPLKGGTLSPAVSHRIGSFTALPQNAAASTHEGTILYEKVNNVTLKVPSGLFSGSRACGT